MWSAVLERRVRSVVMDVLGVGEEDLELGTSLVDDLAADSLDLFQLVLALETEFAVDLPHDVGNQLASVGDLVAVVAAAHLPAGVTASSPDGSTTGDGFEPMPFEARVVGATGGRWERSGWLTPYGLETLIEDARWSAREGAVQITVPAPTPDRDLASLECQLAHWRLRGLRITVGRSYRPLNGAVAPLDARPGPLGPARAASGGMPLH